MAARPEFDPTFDEWSARLELGFEARRQGEAGDSSTVLAHRRHHGPLRVQKALYPEGAGICHAVMLHPPAGVAGGDRLEFDVQLGEGSHAVLTTPGATKWYKSAGRVAVQRIGIHLAAGARLDWLPQENILFQEARPRMTFDLDLAGDASAIGWDACVLGRQSSGEQWSLGDLHADSRIRRAGRPLWIEQARLQADAPLRASAIGLAGLPAFATLWAVGPAADAALAEQCAASLPFEPELRAGITFLADGDAALGGGMLLLRVLGRHIESVRALMIEVWHRLRPLFHGVPGRPLRLWST